MNIFVDINKFVPNYTFIQCLLILILMPNIECDGEHCAQWRLSLSCKMTFYLNNGCFPSKLQFHPAKFSYFVEYEHVEIWNIT